MIPLYYVLDEVDTLRYSNKIKREEDKPLSRNYSQKDMSDGKFQSEREFLNQKILSAMENTKDIEKQDYLRRLLVMNDFNWNDFEVKRNLFNQEISGYQFNTVQEYIDLKYHRDYTTSQYIKDCKKGSKLFLIPFTIPLIISILTKGNLWNTLFYALFLSPIILLLSLIIYSIHEHRCAKRGEERHISPSNSEYQRHKMNSIGGTVASIGAAYKLHRSIKESRKNLSNPEKWDKI